MKFFLLGIASILITACTGLDDEALPADAEGQIYFKSFEIDPRRNYINGRIVNDSPYTLTSCRIAIDIYVRGQSLGEQLQLTEVSPEDPALADLSPTISEKMFMRETLKPGYSTEIYFEFPMQDLQGEAFYTRRIMELKGRASSP